MTVQTLYTAATGMSALETKLDVIANNLANVETVGFKKGRANFEDLFYRHEMMPGATDTAGQYTPTGISVGMGTRVSSIQGSFVQGASESTGGQLDVAIEGSGFFQVTDPSGDTLYTRAGNFSKNSNGQLVMGSANVGRLLDPPITIPEDATDVVISAEGIVSVRQPGSQNLSQVGTIELASFINSGQSGAERGWLATARLAGGLQRGARPRADRPDYHPAGLRAQLQGGAGG